MNLGAYFAFIGLCAVVAFFAGMFVEWLRPKRIAAKAKPLNGGWVLRRARATEHFCKPPDTEGVVEGKNALSNLPYIRVLPLTPRDKWSSGDAWLCDCGKAWRVRMNVIDRAEWVRNEEDDLQ